MDDRRIHSPREGEPNKRNDLKQKRAYVEEVVRTRGPAAVGILLEMLSHESWTMRQSAADGLCRLGPAVLDTVIPLAHTGVWFTRAGAAKVLSNIGGAESVPVLLEMIGESNRTVKEAGADGLVRMCQRGGAASVARAVHRSAPAVREEALQMLGARDAAGVEKVRRLMGDAQIMAAADDADEVWDQDDAAGRGGLVWEVLTGGKNRDAKKGQGP